MAVIEITHISIQPGYSRYISNKQYGGNNQMLTNTLRGNNTMVNTTTKIQEAQPMLNTIARDTAMFAIELIDIYQQQIQELDDMMFCLWNVRDIARAIARRDELEELVASLRKQARN